MHTDRSDGRDTLEDMVRAVKARHVDAIPRSAVATFPEPERVKTGNFAGLFFMVMHIRILVMNISFHC